MVEGDETLDGCPIHSFYLLFFEYTNIEVFGSVDLHHLHLCALALYCHHTLH